MNKVKTTERLTKKERSLIWRRFYNSYGVSGGYDVLSAPNFLWGLAPLFEKYYDNDKKCEELLKHSLIQKIFLVLLFMELLLLWKNKRH